VSRFSVKLPAFSYHLDSSGKYTGVHGGGFCVWILHSMRRRAQERIDQIVEESEIVMAERAKEMAIPVSDSTTWIDDPQAVEWLPGQQMHLQPEGQETKKVSDELETTTMVVPLTFNDEDNEAQTETDGSSVRTPSTGSHISYFPVRPATSLSCHSQTSATSQTFAENANQFQVPSSKDPDLLTSHCSSPTSPVSPTPTSSSMSPTPLSSICPTSSTLSQDLTGSALKEYNHLTDLRERLWQLAMFAESQTRIAAEEVRNRFEILAVRLAVRSRRRAWSAGAFNMTQCKATMKAENGLNVNIGWQSQYGLAMPFRSSPLARFSWTAEELKEGLEKKRGRASYAHLGALPVGTTSSAFFRCISISCPMWKPSSNDIYVLTTL